MPFDSTPPGPLSRLLPMSRLEKLERLRAHLDAATDEEQKSFCLCLLHRAACDPVFVAEGLELQEIAEYRESPVLIPGAIWGSLAHASRFFGVDIELFGGRTVNEKRAILDATIAEERAKTRVLA